MPNFLTQIQELNASRPQPAHPQLEPRRVRRQKARAAAKAQATRSIGAAAVQPSSKNKSAQKKAG